MDLWLVLSWETRRTTTTAAHALRQVSAEKPQVEQTARVPQEVAATMNRGMTYHLIPCRDWEDDGLCQPFEFFFSVVSEPVVT